MEMEEFEAKLSACLLSMLQTANCYRELIYYNQHDTERMKTISDHIDEMARHSKALRTSWLNPESIRLQDLQ